MKYGQKSIDDVTDKFLNNILIENFEIKFDLICQNFSNF